MINVEQAPNLVWYINNWNNEYSAQKEETSLFYKIYRETHNDAAVLYIVKFIKIWLHCCNSEW